MSIKHIEKRRKQLIVIEYSKIEKIIKRKEVE